jgi:hypothetical protein
LLIFNKIFQKTFELIMNDNILMLSFSPDTEESFVTNNEVKRYTNNKSFTEKHLLIFNNQNINFQKSYTTRIFLLN